jgi:CRISPR-associated protein Cas1
MDNMLRWAGNVASGDTQNLEARAAAYYWDRLYGDAKFTRHRFGPPPNHLLNYGYAILRGVCARALVGSGLFPAVGIHHRNKYNPFCLADDIMEPYRPYVDNLVGYIMTAFDDFSELTTPIKKELLQVPALDVTIEGSKSPLMVAMSRTTNSLYECFAGLSRKIIYPEYG